MRTLVTGDIHGEHSIRKFSSKKFPFGKTLTKEDFLIIAGDFGLLFDVNKSGRKEKRWTEWLTDKPWTTLFVDGNHENFHRINKLEEKQMFGSVVGVVNDSIFHLKRGEIYEINGKKIFTMGGARSTDKANRLENISWWREEEPNYEEVNNAFTNIENHGGSVDYVITHTAPVEIVTLMLKAMGVEYKDDSYWMERVRDSTSVLLSEIRKTLKFKKWFFGHFHEELIIEDEFICLYDNIIEV